MDERKKNIRDVEEKKQLELKNNSLLEENLGKALLERFMNDGVVSETGFFVDSLAEHQRFLAEIADAESQIENINTDIQRLKETETVLNQKDGLKALQIKTLSELHTALGERVLNEPDLDSYSKPYQTQVDVIMLKIQEISDKLDGLNNAGEKNNLLSRIGSQIGKSVQGMTLRASLSKQQDLIQKVYAVAGEHFTLAANPTDNAALTDFAAETEEARAALALLNEEIAELRAERSRLTDVFNKEGSPGKHIQTLEKHIVWTQDKLRELYCKTGKDTADTAFAAAVSADEDTRDMLAEDLNEADLAMLDQIALCREKIAHTEKEITSIKAAIAIDEEKAAIEKHNQGIEEQQKRIAASEAEITDLESRITQANAHIEELSALL
jgi:hypothetical protein